MKRGEIWTIGSRTDLRYRVLVLSASDERDDVLEAGAVPALADLVARDPNVHVAAPF